MEFPIKMIFGTFYKAILSLSSIILILSLFFPVYPSLNISNRKVVISSLVWILYSIVAWMLDINTQIQVEHTLHSNEKIDIIWRHIGIQLIILGIFIFGFVQFVLLYNF